MAKKTRLLPARQLGDRSRDEKSLLLQSAESLGRMIGALQRQLDGAARKHRKQSKADGAAMADRQPKATNRRNKMTAKTKRASGTPRTNTPQSTRASKDAPSRSRSSRKQSR